MLAPRHHNYYKTLLGITEGLLNLTSHLALHRAHLVHHAGCDTQSNRGVGPVVRRQRRGNGACMPAPRHHNYYKTLLGITEGLLNLTSHLALHRTHLVYPA